MKTRSAASPFVIWVMLFTVIPLGLVVYYALTNSSGAFTWENILRIGEYSSTFLDSIWLGFLSTVICLLLGYPIAFSMSRSKGNVQQTMVMLVMLPMWMNFLLRTYAWMTLLENNGLINQLLGSLGLSPLSMINTKGAIVLGMVYNFLPYMILPLYSVMTKIDPRVIEAAQDLGANGPTVLRRVIMPLSLPGIMTGITMVFVPAVSTFIISKLLGGGKDMLIGDLIEMMFLGSAPNYHFGAALSLVLMVLILISMGIMNRFDKDDEESSLLL